MSTRDLAPIALSPDEAGPLVGLSGQTIRRLCRQGQLRHRRVGRRVLIPYSALLELAEGAPVLPGSTPTAEAGHGPGGDPSRVVVAQTGPGTFSAAPAESAATTTPPVVAATSQQEQHRDAGVKPASLR